MKKIAVISLICLILICTSFNGFAAQIYYPETPVSAKAYYLYSLDTGEMISQRNADQPVYPASTTKIMTCILALEQTADLDAATVIYPQYIQNYLYTYQQRVGAISLSGLIAGETLSMRQLLYALMLPSGNEAAMIIADHIAGSQEDFLVMMNARAKELGALNTNFANANGLHDENHVTTAMDMAKIAEHAITLPGFMDIVNKPAHDSGPTSKHDNLHWESTNYMIMPENQYYYPGLSGIKTGTLPEAGRCFVSTATRDGFKYLLVVMGSDYYDENGKQLPGNMAFNDTKILYDWVFDSYRVKTLVEKGKYVAEIPLKLSMDKDYITLMTSDRFTALMYYMVEASNVMIVPEIPDYIDAPVKEYDKIGEARLMLSGEEIGRVDLLAAESVEASQPLVILEKVKRVLASFWFKFGVIYAFLLIIAYIITMISRNRRRRASAYRPRRRI